MKKIGLIIFVLVCSSCVSKSLKSYEEGSLVNEKFNLKETYLYSSLGYRFQTLKIDDVPYLKISVEKFNNYNQKWQNSYQKVAVYQVEQKNSFIDNPRMTIEKKNTDEIVLKDLSADERRKEDLSDQKIVFVFNDKEYVGDLKSGSANFPIKKLGIDFNNIEKFKSASLKIDQEVRNVTNDFYDFLKDEYRSLHPEKFYTGQKYLEYKYKMNLCENPDVFYSIVSMQTKFKSKCMYLIKDRFKVFQSTRQGALLQAMGLPYEIPQQTIFLRTKKRYVDEERMENVLAEYEGPTSYSTVLGAEKTVHSFKFLGAVKMIYNRDGEVIQFAEDQD